VIFFRILSPYLSNTKQKRGGTTTVPVANWVMSQPLTARTVVEHWPDFTKDLI
jgi:hypothetical protein